MTVSKSFITYTCDMCGIFEDVEGLTDKNPTHEAPEGWLSLDHGHKHFCSEFCRDTWIHKNGYQEKPYNPEGDEPTWSEQVYWYQNRIGELVMLIDQLTRHPFTDDAIRAKLAQAMKNLERAEALADKYDAYVEQES